MNDLGIAMLDVRADVAAGREAAAALASVSAAYGLDAGLVQRTIVEHYGADWSGDVRRAAAAEQRADAERMRQARPDMQGGTRSRFLPRFARG